MFGKCRQEGAEQTAAAGGGQLASGGGWRWTGGDAGSAGMATCGPADGARGTGAGPVLPRRRPWRVTSPGPGPDVDDYFCPQLII